MLGVTFFRSGTADRVPSRALFVSLAGAGCSVFDKQAEDRSNWNLSSSTCSNLTVGLHKSRQLSASPNMSVFCWRGAIQTSVQFSQGSLSSVGFALVFCIYLHHYREYRKTSPRWLMTLGRTKRTSRCYNREISGVHPVSLNRLFIT